jgi:hypothetical protein
MIDEAKAMEQVDSILETARGWAKDNITQRYTGTMTIEIGFLDGGVRAPAVKETRVLVLRKVPA